MAFITSGPERCHSPGRGQVTWMYVFGRSATLVQWLVLALPRGFASHRTGQVVAVHSQSRTNAFATLKSLLLSAAVLVLVLVIDTIRRWRFGNDFRTESQSGQHRHDPF